MLMRLFLLIRLTGRGMPASQEKVPGTKHVAWLRAAVLGANDGIVSTGSLLLGVAAAHGTHSNVLIAGAASLVAGAMSMAAGEFVSVHSQEDAEQADLQRERAKLEADSESERKELVAIYVERGLDRALAEQVADQLIARDALGAYARDELGMSEPYKAHPIQAAVASACSYSFGAVLPLLVAALFPTHLIVAVSATSLVFLAVLGALAAHTGGANMTIAAIRVTFWGALALGVTMGVGALLGTSVW